MLKFTPNQQPPLTAATAGTTSIGKSNHVNLPPVSGQHRLAGGGTPRQGNDVLVLQHGAPAAGGGRESEAEQDAALRGLDDPPGRVGLVVDGVGPWGHGGGHSGRIMRIW